MAGTLELEFLIKKTRSKLDRLRRPTGEGIQRFERRVYSQHREDGIIDHILRTTGISNTRCVEFGFGPAQCNCLSLVLDRNFQGLFIDSDSDKVSTLSTYFSRHAVSSRVVNRFLDVDNINRTIRDAGFAGEVAVLSIDVDGNDYWLWQVLDTCRARLVVIEYNASFGAHRSITVPYEPDFVRYEKHRTGFYHGASLLALEKLAASRGYALIGCDSSGVNAFFLDKALVSENLPEVAVEQAFRDNRSRTRYKGIPPDRQWEVIADMPFHDVGSG